MSDIGNNENIILKFFSAVVRFIASEIRFLVNKFKRTFSKDNVKESLRSKVGSFVFFIIVASVVIIGYFSLNAAKNNAITYNVDYEAPEKTANLDQKGTYVKVGQTDALELLFCELNGAIKVVDRKDGYIWDALADDDMIQGLGLKPSQDGYQTLRSVLKITCNDMKDKAAEPVTRNSLKHCGELSYELIENGVSVTYGFLTQGIYVTVEYLLDDDNLVVRIPYDKIVELSKFGLTSVEVLPAFGACTNDVDGYLFYPDGPGAVTTFAKAKERTSSGNFATYYTYSPKGMTIASLVNGDYYKSTTSMPVFGIKNGDHAVFGFASEYIESVGVKVTPSRSTLLTNTASFEISIRNILNTSSINISGRDDTGKSATRIDKKPISETKEVRYAFLSGDEANYSGMAKYYREYLIEKGILEKSTAGSDISLALSLLMATKKDGIIFDENIKMTDFDDTIEILESLKSKGISDVQLTLFQWENDYENANLWKPSSTVGGTSGLKKLSEYVSDNKGVNAYLASDLLSFTSKTKKVKATRDSAADLLDVEMGFERFDGTTLYLTNPATAKKRSLDLASKLQKYSGIGIGIFGISSVCYADYQPANPFTKTEAANVYKSLFDELQTGSMPVAANGTNGYVLSGTDYLFEIDESSYGRDITDYEVPFIQMVISGYIPYSTSGYGNLSYDIDIQKLKWIEFGSLPSFYLTYESALNLRDSYNDGLFSATYSDWEDTAVNVYNEFKGNFACVYGKQMVRHEVLQDDVVEVTYENGVRIVINYSDRDVTIRENTSDLVKIPAKDYLVLGGIQ